MNINPIKEITITIPVPKSGSSIMSPNNIKITPKIGNINLNVFLFSLSLFDKYFAVKIIIASFESSLGYVRESPSRGHSFPY